MFPQLLQGWRAILSSTTLSHEKVKHSWFSVNPTVHSYTDADEVSIEESMTSCCHRESKDKWYEFVVSMKYICKAFIISLQTHPKPLTTPKPTLPCLASRKLTCCIAARFFTKIAKAIHMVQCRDRAWGRHS